VRPRSPLFGPGRQHREVVPGDAGPGKIPREAQLC